MPTYTIEEADKWLNVVALNMKGAALKGLYSAALRMQQHIVINIIPSITPEPTARGTYKAAWRTVRLPNGAEVVNTLFQAILIEKGVRAENVKIGRKLIDALVEWIHIKGIGAHTTVTVAPSGKNSKTRSGITITTTVTKAADAEARQIAWAIAQSMRKHGIFNRGKGWNVLGRATKLAPQFIREEVARELKKEFSR